MELKTYPNPFFSQTTLKLETPVNDATLTLYNLHGQVVKEIKNINGQIISLSRDNLPSGHYFIRLIAADENMATTKVLIVDGWGRRL